MFPDSGSNLFTYLTFLSIQLMVTLASVFSLHLFSLSPILASLDCISDWMVFRVLISIPLKDIAS